MGASNSKRDALEGLCSSPGSIAVSPGQWTSASSSLEHVSSLPGVREAQGRNGSLPEVSSSIPLASASAHVDTATASTASPSASMQVPPTSPTATPPLPPTTSTTNAPAPSPPATHPSPFTHKSTTLIPGWSRKLSSQQLQIECQKVARPASTPSPGGPLSKAGPREDLGVLKMEVMKFVAYCGGVSIKFRIDEISPLPTPPHGSTMAPLVWGLVSTCPCTALLQAQQQQQPPTAASSTGRALPPPLTIPSDNGCGSSGSSATGGGSQGALRGGGVLHPPNPATSVAVDSPSRKPLYATCTASKPAGRPVLPSDVLSIDLAPREDKQPVIVASLRFNDKLMLQQSLPCASISSLQMYPFITLQPGMTASLHEATTPSPLFTWYQPAAMATSPDIELAELDTCVMFQAPPSTGDPPPPPASLSSAATDFMGSATFTSGRHRWTVQLDNFSAAPVNIFVGVAASADSHTLANGGTNILSQEQGPLRSIAGSASAAAAEPASGGPCSPRAAPIGGHSSNSNNSCSRLHAAGVAAATAAADATSPASTGAGPSGFAAAEQGGSSGSSSGSRFAQNLSVGGLARFSTGPVAHATSFVASPSSTPDTSGKSGGALLGVGADSGGACGGEHASSLRASQDADTACSAPSQAPVSSLSCKWGAWVHLPGSASAGPCPPDAYTPPHPPCTGFTHTTQATSSHCFVTVDLDLDHGYVRFFRNGHIIGAAFYGLAGPISPMLAFAHAPNLLYQAGLVNLTKLRQLDLTWNADKCSADLRLSGSVVSKVSEAFGDYSTVLAAQGFISGVHLWLVKVNSLAEPDSIFIGVCRGCMPLDQDPQDLRDRTYYLSNGVVRVGGRRVATSAANFTKGDVVGVVLDADQGEIVFFRNGSEQGRARGIRGRLYPFISCDSESDQVTLLGSYSLLLDRIPRQLADMEWDTLHHAPDIELSSNCLTSTKTSSSMPSTLRGTMLYTGTGYHEFHVILDSIGPDGVWVGVAPPDVGPMCTVGDVGCGWALHSDGDKRFDGREDEFTQPFKSGDVLTVCVDMGQGTLSFNRNGQSLGVAFRGLTGTMVAAATLASEESKITIQNRPTVLNTGEYIGELRWDEARAGKDLLVIDGLTVTKMANEGGDYATVLGTLCLASGQHSWNVYINHVEDSNLFIGVTVGGHELNADPQEMKYRTYYLSNGTIRVAGKLVTRCAEPYAEGDLVSVQLDMDQRHIKFLKNGVAQGLGDGLPEEVWPYISLDNIMDSITLHSSSMFADLMQSLRWSADAASPHVMLPPDGAHAQLHGGPNGEEVSGQGTVLGMREMSTAEVHSWVVRFEQPSLHLQQGPANFLVGVAPPDMDLCRSLGEDGCGIGLDYFGYFYVNGRYFHATNLQHWTSLAKPVRGSTAKHKGKAHPIFVFTEGKCEVTITLDLKEKTLKFAHGGKNIGTIAGVQGPLHAAATVTSSKQKAVLAPGPMGRAEHTNEELVSVLKAKGCALSARAEAALLLIPRDLFVPKDRHREAFRDQKLTVRMADGSTMTLPPPSFVVSALDRLGVGNGCRSFLDVGCGTGYVCALAACLLGGDTVEQNCSVHALECASSRLEGARANVRALREHLAGPMAPDVKALDDPSALLSRIEFSLSNVLIPECTNGVTYDALYCDAALGEEDLPMLLSLLKPNGRMVVVIQEEALLISRSGVDPHDFNRELICRLSGDFGELEGATPWEVQDAISRIKERERRHGKAQAKQDTASLRSFEYVEMQQRVQAAMQRISELEAMIKASDLGSMRSPAGHLTSSSCFDGGLRSPARSSGVDDVRVVAKDKSRHRRCPSTSGTAAVLAKPSPRASSNARMSPLPSLNVTDSGDWKAMYTTTNGSGPAQDTTHPSPARARARSLFAELPDQDEPDTCTAASDKGVGGVEDSRGMRGQSVGGSPCSPSIGTASSEGNSEGPQVQMSPRTLADIIESMSVQTFSVDEVTQMTSGSEPSKIENREVYQGTYKGMQVRVWRVHVDHGVSYLDLKRAYSRYCVAHPNISAVLGVCIQPGAGAPPPTPGSAYPTFPLTPSGASAAAAAADCGPPTDLLQSPTVPRMSPPPHSRLAVSSSTKRKQYCGALHCDNTDDSHPDTGEGLPEPAQCPSPHLCTPPRRSLTPPTHHHHHTHTPATTTSHRHHHSRSGSMGFWPPRTPLGTPLSGAAAGGWPATPHTPHGVGTHQPHTLWVVEERFGDRTLATQLERGLMSWRQVGRIATDVCKALTFLQDLKRHSACTTGSGTANNHVNSSSAYARAGNGGGGDNCSESAWSAAEDGAAEDGEGWGATQADPQAPMPEVLSAYALRTLVSPSTVTLDAQSTKVSVLPALLNHLEVSTGGGAGGWGEGMASTPCAATAAATMYSSPWHSDMAYVDPSSGFSEGPAPSLYAFGVVLLQLLTERGPLGLVRATREAVEQGTLLSLIPRVPANAEILAWAGNFARLALRCTQPGAVTALDAELLPELEGMADKLGSLGSMSWEQVEELLMLPLQPYANGSDGASRRWVRQDFRMRRRLFLEEVAKLAVEGPVHKIEVRRARCFKDSVAVFAGKGHAVWRQPLKVAFLGEQGMDSGGVTREWFSALSSAISRGSPELFCPAGAQQDQLYINPLSASSAHLKKFHFVGLFMAKAILESAARGRDLGAITLNLPFCEPLWKLLLGQPLHLVDLQLLDPTEFRSLVSILDMDIDGLIFETFAWNFTHSSAAAGAQHPTSTPTPSPAPHHLSAASCTLPSPSRAPTADVFLTAASSGSTTTAGYQLMGGEGSCREVAVGSSSGRPATPSASTHCNNTSSSSSSNLAAAGSSPQPVQASTPTHAHPGGGGAAGLGTTATPPASPFAAADGGDSMVTSIPLKPGGTHLKVSNHNKREYVLLKAHKMLVGTIEAQMGAIIDAFHSVIPRELLEKYAFTSLELQLVVCGEQHIDVQDLQHSCKYEDGYTGKEELIGWFWDVVEGFSDVQRRMLLQFWSGSDGQPADGFASLDPAFHMVAVDRLYDANDTTARLPAAHTCFRQLDLPRYASREELREKLVTAITIGQGYMALS